MSNRWRYHDGGHAAAGFKGHAGDCVCRAIAIATHLPYGEVYETLNVLTRPARLKGGRSGARYGIPTVTIKHLLAALGWQWVPTMHIGSGCRVHLRAEELPGGRLIVNCSRHLVAVIDGIAYDTHDPTRGGTRCVYGFWRRVG